MPDAAARGFDPRATRRAIEAIAPLGQRYFRWRVDGFDTFPREGGGMLVSNHSGGIMTADVLMLAAAYYDHFGYQRPLYTLGHDALFTGPLATIMPRFGLIRAGRAAAVEALRSGGVVLVFPGGLFDAFRPVTAANTVDFNGRDGYIRVAVEAGVPVVPAVSIGGQESQLFLTRGTWLADRLGLRRVPSEILPITAGFPFGLSAVLPLNLPLPTKIVTRVLPPIDITGRFGADADVARVDQHVRARMQEALDELARERRLPVLG